ncbi:MAG: 50S ribosomal protein L9 [Candidatus Hydrogenedentes bacterium CG07_land_8_20_14_0_80_42_17]|nr:MAG: 50S ribosomal protein L9 [Candidatus Hydrogenedentes bacterium CG1_02_42_14]PIU46923.1 MAG: 50S ribosomal protein L9 [Candidatus Hydrogenedentes bacterium CG07_land_8_20_14_0_80_42_17]
MKVILQESLDNLGMIGDVVNVKDGYARNYLFPQKKAVIATPDELRRLEFRRDKIDKLKVAELEAARQFAERIKEISVTKSMRVSEEGSLYGSVGISDIAELLKAAGHEIDKKQVLLSEPIKALGSFTVPVRLHPEVTVDIKVSVVEEKTE